MKKWMLSAMVAMAAAGAAAGEYFNVNFDDCAVDAMPAAKPYRRGGEAGTAPTRIQELEPGFVKVVKESGDLKMPLLINIGASNTNKSEVVFDGGNDLVKTGVVKLSFKLQPVSYTPAADGNFEIPLSIRITGNGGVSIGTIVYGLGGRNVTSGPIVLHGKRGCQTRLGDFTMGKTDSIEITIDLANSTISGAVNGEARGEKVEIDPDRPFRLLHFTSGRAIGGRDGALTVALDDVKISSQE